MEALALTKNDIDLDKKTITVNKNLITKGNTAEIKPSPKSKAGNRTIPIPDILTDALKQYLPTVNTVCAFPSATGVLMSKIAFRRFWDKIIKQLNISMDGNNNIRVLASDVTPYLLRHTYSTMLYYRCRYTNSAIPALTRNNESNNGNIYAS